LSSVGQASSIERTAVLSISRSRVEKIAITRVDGATGPGIEWDVSAALRRPARTLSRTDEMAATVAPRVHQVLLSPTEPFVVAVQAVGILKGYLSADVRGRHPIFQEDESQSCRQGQPLLYSDPDRSRDAMRSGQRRILR
jgi:hypothetical protein